ncbi:MAG: DUF1592 domain-containing protein [Myxococcaceae bacterium]|nr:DUF1592 domain-containing protein [Myxococcaceae bacterium]
MRSRLLGAVLLAAGCSGLIDGGQRQPSDEPGGPLVSASDAITSPQVRRLTRAEYQATVEDLFPQAPRVEVPRELAIDGHGTIARAQLVGYADTSAFLDAAEAIAEAVAPSLDTQLAACSAAACRTTWMAAFLERCFRGVPDDAQVQRYVALLESTEGGPTQVERLQVVVVAALSSPDFLYRKELGLEATGRVRTLTPDELAARLSYLVWLAGPDAELTRVARSGDLANPDVRKAQLARLLADPKARRSARAFVRDWLALGPSRIPSKSADTLSGLPDTVAADAERALDLLIDDVAAPATGTFAGLLRADYAFVNASLAPLFGATPPSGTGFSRVTLDSKRRGVLFQPVVFAAHTKEAGVSPFPMGKFLLENVTCESVGNPPASFPTVEEPAGTGRTLRQELEARTSGSGCVECHQRIGPPGFAFLPFDPLGRYRAADGANRPFDTSGSFTFEKSKAAITFADAASLSQALSTSEDLMHCLSRRSFRFAFGRFEAPDEAEVLARLDESAVAQRTSVKALFEQLVTADTFTSVRVRETP